ncbi:MAG TPA: ABC transporter permease [Gaiellaceae bacterium]|nr:ABC transporter permease [Gaiellaceae bacterium]
MTSTTPDSLSAELPAPPRQADVFEAPADKVEILDYYPTLRETLGEAWRSRTILLQLSITAVTAYFRKYRLGPTWLILQTFMGLIGYTLIFGGGVFNVRAPNGMPYFLFTMVGMMGWSLFQSTLQIGARSFLRLRSLVRDIHVPLILVPIAGSAQAIMRFALYLIAYVIAVVYYWAAQGRIYAQLQIKYLALSVLGLFLCAMLAWGISMWTAPLTAHTRDVRMVLKYIIPFWMFVTPVLYPIEHLQGKTRLVAELNPLSSPVEMAKVGLIGAGSVRLYAAIWSIGLIAAVFASGVWFMNRFGQRVVGLTSDLDDDDEDALI